jgi:hypothetical protein
MDCGFERTNAVLERLQVLPVRCSVFLYCPLYLTHIEMIILWHGACTADLAGNHCAGNAASGVDSSGMTRM